MLTVVDKIVVIVVSPHFGREMHLRCIQSLREGLISRNFTEFFAAHGNRRTIRSRMTLWRWLTARSSGNESLISDSVCRARLRTVSSVRLLLPGRSRSVWRMIDASCAKHHARVQNVSVSLQI